MNDSLDNTPIRLTERAVEHIRSWLSEHDISDRKSIRVGIKTTGCSGYQYVVEIAEQIHDDDVRFADQGVDLVVDPQSLRYLKGCEMDFVQQGLRSNFEFHNPNAAEMCGCGESFSVKEDAGNE